MPEDYEEFISLTLRTRNSWKSSECKNKIGNTNGSSHALQDIQEKQAWRDPQQDKWFRLILRVSWKPVNPQECVWENHYRIIMRTILHEEETIHYNITIWYKIWFLCLKQWRYPKQKQQVDKEWEKSEKIPAWDLTKVRSKKQVIDEARMSGAKVHFSSLMDICHLKSAELEAKHQKYKGRVVLPGDIVKDGCGSYAVYTEQGSSASHRTAAKIMDIISRLPGCDGQAADAVSAYTQVKM